MTVSGDLTAVEPILQCWGKAYPRDRQPYHPVAYHCLDVAACALVLLERMPLLRQRLSELLDVDKPEPLLVALIALHDIGKFSRAFQQKAPACWRADVYGDLSDAPADPGHGMSGLYLWRKELWPLVDPADALLPLARAVFGHHGSPISETQETMPLRNIFGRGGLRLAQDFAQQVTDLMEPGVIGPNAACERASWLVAGVVVLADWIGSSQAWFPYHAPGLGLAEYWKQVAKPKARDAVDAAGVLPALSAQSLTYPRLTGIAGFVATPMQAWVETAPIASGLYIIEDSTGAGKTEAAVMLAHRIIAAGLAEGLYVALPTMATADGMFGRMGRMYRRLFTDAVAPSLALAHGGRDLHAGFQAAIRIPDPDTGNFVGAEKAEDVSYCSAWIADDRRKTFLAQVGVGTVDQALLAILPSFHQSLRVLGLAQRVLVLDEVHAYDAYMNQEIIRLLEMQAALGGTTILLSATLPAETKMRLLRAYGCTASVVSSSYPLATFKPTAEAGIVQDAVQARQETIRCVPLSFVTTREEGLQQAIDAARNGQAVLYIRNTVADAMETFEAIPADIHAQLFHARFAMCDRQRIQNDAIDRFGKDGTSEQRRGQLLVATQVVEQSLDLDFDLIVTDLAPIDLIIQRAGRLWRHDRGERQPQEKRRAPSAVCNMVVVGPAPDATADAEWLPRALRRSSYVYQDHARIWLTAEALRKAQAINAPEDLRSLIEHVYGANAEQRVPIGLRAGLAQARVQSGVERAAAVAGMLAVEGGYTRAEPWDTDERVMTRLNADTVKIRLAEVRDGRITPWAQTRTDETDIHRRWALSEVGLRGSVGGDAIPAGLDAATRAAKATWTSWQRDALALVIVLADGSTPTNLTYSSRLGLRRAR